MSYCKLYGEGLKESACHNQACQMVSGALEDDVKNVNLLGSGEKKIPEGVSVKDEMDVGDIHFESQVSEELECDGINNVNPLDGTGKDLHEGVFVKDGIDSDEAPFESQVNEEFEFFLVKSEVKSEVESD